jgi:hypothetical protein
MTAASGAPQVNERSDTPVCRFYRLIPGAPEPRRADRSANGTLPADALRYCEPVTSASAFGWYVYPPLNFALTWDGAVIEWTYDGADAWLPLHAAQAPDFLEIFRSLAPSGLEALAPTFLSQGQQPGAVQVWSGYLAWTAPRWALLSRGVANHQRTQAYENFEGIFQTDTWFGPLFTNVRLTKTDSPVSFHMREPMFQVQPLLRECYRDPAFEILEASNLTPADWERFADTMMPNTDLMRARGHDAAATRQRRRGEETQS